MLDPECAEQYSPTQAVLAKVSGRMLLGRAMPLVATAHGYGAGGPIPPTPQDVPIHWTTSNPAVVSISQSEATARAVGTATLTASACGKSDAVEVNVSATGYDLVAVELPPSLSSAYPLALNDAGWVLATDGTKVPTRTTFLWRQNNPPILLEGCAGIDLNRKREVLCEGKGPRVWIDGVVVQWDTVLAHPFALNDRSHVAAKLGGTVTLWRGAGDISPVGSSVWAINFTNDDRVLGGNYDGSNYPKPLVTGLPEIPLSGGFGRTAVATDMNSATVVGASEFMSGLGGGSAAVIWEFPNWVVKAVYPITPLSNDMAAGAGAINAAGTILGGGSQGGWVWSSGRLALLSFVIPDDKWRIAGISAINTSGQILATGHYDGGPARPVLLVPRG